MSNLKTSPGDLYPEFPKEDFDTENLEKTYKKKKPLVFSNEALNKCKGFSIVPIFDMDKIRAAFLELDRSEKNRKALLGKFANRPICGCRYVPILSENFIKELSLIKKDFPNCLEFLNFIEDFAYLSSISNRLCLNFPPVLLAGPPGVGKTAVLTRLASIVHVPFRKIDCATLTSPAVISGSPSTYADSRPGFILEMLRDNPIANPLVLFDEIDKVVEDYKGLDMLGGLYTLLEGNTSNSFSDETLDFPFDASFINFCASANNTDLMSDAILSRFTVIYIEPLEESHSKAIISSIYREIIVSGSYDRFFKLSLPDELVDALTGLSPRVIKKILYRSLGRACKSLDKTQRKKVALSLENLVLDTETISDRAKVPFGFNNT